MNWEEVGIIKASKVKQKILTLLLNQPKTPKDISNILEKHLSQVSKNLRVLEKRELVKCLNPQLKKGRFYTTTNKGKELMEKLSHGEK
ncbi:MAG: ArsR family transcriptional regulator [Promethearchaeota archaeon]